MAEEDAHAGRHRRMRARRSGMAFSGGSISHSTAGARTPAEDPQDDHPDLNASVVTAATTPAVSLPPREGSTIPAIAGGNAGQQEEFNPAARLAQVTSRSSDYAREYRLGLLHRMVMRNLPQDEIAQQLGISVRQVQRDLSDLKARLREAARSLDIDEMIGGSKGFYEEVQAMSMRAASNSNVPMPMRLAAMRTALAAHNDMHRFYQASGVYDVLRFRKGAGEGAQTDIQRLMSITEDLLTEAKRDSRPSNPLGDFSGNDRENMEL